MRIRRWLLLAALGAVAACGTTAGSPQVAPAPGPWVRVWVEGEDWQRVENLSEYGRDAPVYTVSRDRDGSAAVTFGDGIHGRRPSSGSEVQVTYRFGWGGAEPIEISVKRQVGGAVNLPNCMRLEMEAARFAFRPCDEDGEN